MHIDLKRHQTGVNSRCENVVCRKLLERTDNSIKVVNDVLVRLVVRTVARHIKSLSQKSRQYEQRTSITPTYRSARRVLAELRLDHRPSSTACRPDHTASPRVPIMRRSGSPG